MFVLSKKRILYIVSVIVISIFSFSVIELNNITIETSSTPVSNHIIILDAGHGLPDRSVLLLLMVPMNQL